MSRFRDMFLEMLEESYENIMESDLKLIKKIFKPELDFHVGKIGSEVRQVQIYGSKKSGNLDPDSLYLLPGITWGIGMGWRFDEHGANIDRHKLMRSHVKKIEAILKKFNMFDSNYLKKLKTLIMNCWKDAKIAYIEVDEKNKGRKSRFSITTNYGADYV